MQKLRDVFTKSAPDYDRFACIQSEIARDLFNYIVTKEKIPGRVLDIGMGTGNLIRLLSNSKLNAEIFGMDLSSGMLNCAKNKFKGNLSCVQADAVSLPFKDVQFDLVVSNLTYQWVRSLNEAFSEIRRILKDKGKFYFTCFTRNTLCELRESFSFESYILPSADLIEDALNKNSFEIKFIEKPVLKRHYPDIFSLVRWLKQVGANYTGQRFRFWGKDRWAAANEYYADNFKDNGKIIATFELVKIEAAKI